MGAMTTWSAADIVDPSKHPGVPTEARPGHTSQPDLPRPEQNVGPTDLSKVFNHTICTEDVTTKPSDPAFFDICINTRCRGKLTKTLIMLHKINPDHALIKPKTVINTFIRLHCIGQHSLFSESDYNVITV